MVKSIVALEKYQSVIKGLVAQYSSKSSSASSEMIESLLSTGLNSIKKSSEQEATGKLRKDMVSFTNQLASSDQDKPSKDDADADLQLDEATVSNICPISNGPIVQQAKNIHCQHIFDMASISQYISEQKRRKRIPKCPLVGCRNQKELEMADFVTGNTADSSEFDLLSDKYIH